MMTHNFHPTSLREYDIRGIVGETLGEADAYAIGRGFGTLISRAGGKSVAVGYDGRVSSPILEESLVRGLNDSGIHAVRVGMGPTPMLYYAEATEQVDGGIQITGSHNPANYNGFKMVFQGRPFFGEDIQLLGKMAAEGDWVSGSAGSNTVDIMDRYVARLVESFDGAGFRIGWDAGNGAAGPVVEKLVKLLPGEHHTALHGSRRQFSQSSSRSYRRKESGRFESACRGKKTRFRSSFRRRWRPHRRDRR
jgi:phosphomannomutase